MIEHYLKTTWRSYFRDKTFSLISIFGLTIGLLACMLVATVVIDDLSYDKFWSKSEDIYRIIRTDHRTTGDQTGEQTMANFGTELRHHFPEVEAAGAATTYEQKIRLDKLDGENITIHVLKADTNVWSLLDFQVLAGAPKHFVAGENSIVISASLKDKLFPQQDAVGKTIYQHQGYGREGEAYVISGIIADLPQNTYLRSDALIVTKPIPHELNRGGWGVFQEQLVRLRPKVDAEQLTDKINKWYSEFLTEADESTRANFPTHTLQPIQDSYLKSDFASQPIKGNLNNIYIFSIVAGLVLLIACINFVNLSLAKSLKQVRESGIRKVLGASRKQLIYQSFTDASLTFLLAGIVASALYLLTIPALEQFVGHQLTLKLFTNVSLSAAFIGTLFVLIALNVAYPAWVFSGIDTANALKNKLSKAPTSSGDTLRRALISFQFGIALLVMIGLITMQSQLRYIKNKPLGFDASQVLVIPSFGQGQQAHTLKNQIDQLVAVEHSSLSSWIPTRGYGGMSKRVEDPNKKGDNLEINFIGASNNLYETLNFKLLKGRQLSPGDTLVGISSQIINFDEEEAAVEKPYTRVLINETAAKIMNISALDSPIHALSIIPVGIVQDFHSTSLHAPIRPTVVMAENNIAYASLLIKVKAGQENNLVQAVERLWRDFYGVPMPEVQSVQALVDKQYAKEQTQQQLLTTFSLLALLLSSLGVFGMILHATVQRTKEIGVRKVLGASIHSILLLFSKDYIKMMLVALLVFSPIAWYATNKWLEDFAYRVDVQWWFFGLAWLVVFVVSMLTINLQTLKAARTNPVNSLRDE